jgi:toxin ParE1/3/4
MGRTGLSTAARADLVGHFIYLAEEAGEAVAERFLARAEESFGLLASHPEIGPVVPTNHPALAGTRKWRVKEFERFLIFYMPQQGGGVRVLRVLHAAQDWWTTLGLTE